MLIKPIFFSYSIVGCVKVPPLQGRRCRLAQHYGLLHLHSWQCILGTSGSTWRKETQTSRFGHHQV